MRRQLNMTVLLTLLVPKPMLVAPRLSSPRRQVLKLVGLPWGQGEVQEVVERLRLDRAFRSWSPLGSPRCPCASGHDNDADEVEQESLG